jgi:tyrosine-protein phosphatase SIW14
MQTPLALAALSFGVFLAASVQAQQVTRESVPGVTNFARLETTIACAGATKAEAVPELKKMGFASIINLREASEAGADVDREAAAAKAAGMNYTHIPFNVAAPAPETVERFLAAVTRPENNPAFIHCAGGGRAATMWAIKRIQVDGWDQQKALDEAAALGMNSDRLKTFAINYVQTHKR